MLSELASGLTGPIAACIAVVAVATGVGLHVGYFIARREGATEAIASALGMKHIPPAQFVRACTLACGGLGAVVAVTLGVAAMAGAHVELPVAAATLLFSYLLGSALWPIVQVPDSRGDAVRASMAGGWVGVGAAGVLAAIVEYWAVTCTLGAGAAVGGLLGLGWLLTRRWVGRRVRRWTGQFPKAPAGLAAVELGFAAVGFTQALAWVLIGAPRAPAWLMLALLGSLGVGLFAAWRTGLAAVPPLRVYRAVFAGYHTTILERLGDGDPIFALHGIAQTEEDWRQAIQLFEGHRIVAVALPEIADSADRIPDGPMLQELQKFVKGAYQELFAGQEVIGWGMSLGGRLILDLVIEGLIKRYVTVGTAGFEAVKWMDIAEKEWLLRLINVVGRKLPPRARAELALVAYRRAQRHPTQLAVRTVRQRGRDPEMVDRVLRLADLGREMMGNPIDPQDIPHDAIGLLLWGQYDSISPPTIADKVTRLRHDLDVRVVDGVKHSIPMQEPELFVRIVQGSPVFTSRPRPVPVRRVSPEPPAPARPGRARRGIRLRRRPAGPNTEDT